MKSDVQHYLSRVERDELLEKNDKKELYLLFVNCLEVRAGWGRAGSETGAGEGKRPRTEILPLF